MYTAGRNSAVGNRFKMHDNTHKHAADTWLDQIGAQINAIDWSQLVRSRHTLHCRMLRNRATLMYPANLWHTDARAFEWLQACAIANKMQLREASEGEVPAKDFAPQGVSTLGLHMLLYPDEPHNADPALQNGAPGCDIAAVVRLAQLARKQGRCTSGASNALLQTTADDILIYSCKVVSAASSRVLEYYAGQHTQVVSYSVCDEQYVDVLLGGGEASAALTDQLSRMIGHRIELEIFAESGKPAIGLLRASYSRPLANLPGHHSTQDQAQAPAMALSPA